MKKFLNKLLMFIIPLLISLFVAVNAYGLLGNLFEDHPFFDLANYQNNIVSIYLISALPIFFVLLILFFSFIFFRKLTIKFPRLIVSLILLFVLGINFLFKPSKITGGDAGPYKKGQIVLSYSRQLGIKKNLSINDVVIFKRNNITEGVGIITSLPSDKIQNTYLTTGEKFEVETVPSGFYALKFSEGRDSWLVPENNIKHIVWYPFK